MKNRMRELRERQGLTQEELGQLLGFSLQAINALEKKKYDPSIWLAYRLSKVFRLPIEEIFLFEESEAKP